MNDPESSADGRKRAAAIRACDWIQEGMTVGLGTGSTVRYLLEEIARRRDAGGLREIAGIPTSTETARCAKALGIPLRSLTECPELDLTLDGADEVDPELRLIKGLGGALLREKIVATASRELVIMVDDAKMVKRLGTKGPLPVEVDPFGASLQLSFLRELGGEPVLRLGTSGEPVVTDGGHHLLDCHFPEGISDPAALEGELDRRVGIVGSGLFLGMTSAVVVAEPGGVRILRREEASR
ncbi:MAG: ribose-5-phosphate isomerase RpiA [Gemmatimonadota bacterium]|nr:ribose-5-phosphate isomerase RpiA [Gemmatimonadota bacterium]